MRLLLSVFVLIVIAVIVYCAGVIIDPPPAETSTRPSPGQMFAALDAAEQAVHEHTGHYATAAEQLHPLRLATETRVRPLRASTTEYQLQLDVGVAGGMRSCVIAGGRTEQNTPRPFTVNCVHYPLPNER